MNQAFTYQISDLDHFVTDTGYVYAEADDIGTLALQLEDRLLSERPALNNIGLVLVIGDAAGKPLHFRPLGVIH